jgi:hypothetical protein
MDLELSIWTLEIYESDHPEMPLWRRWVLEVAPPVACGICDAQPYPLATR